MLLKMLKSADLIQLRSFVSPLFFEVLPPAQMTSQGWELLKSSKDRAGFQRVGLGQYSCMTRRAA